MKEKKWVGWGWRCGERRGGRVRMKWSDDCFLPNITALFAAAAFCCEWQMSCKWMIMACLAWAHPPSPRCLLFPVNISASSPADLSAALLFLLIFNAAQTAPVLRATHVASPPRRCPLHAFVARLPVFTKRFSCFSRHLLKPFQAWLNSRSQNTTVMLNACDFCCGPNGNNRPCADGFIVAGKLWSGRRKR